MYSDQTCLIHDLAAAKQVLRELCSAKIIIIMFLIDNDTDNDNSNDDDDSRGNNYNDFSIQTSLVFFMTWR